MNTSFKSASKAYDQKNYAKTLKIINELEQIEQEQIDVLYLKALSLLHLNQSVLSEKVLKKLTLKEPENPFRYSCLAYVQTHNKKFDLAKKNYQKAIELDPEDEISKNNLLLLDQKQEHKHVMGTKLKPNYIKQDVQSNSYLSIIKQVFTKKSTFNEFIEFIKKIF